MLHTYPLGDACICLDTVHDIVMATNRVGAHVWSLHAQGWSVARIAQSLTDQYDVDATQAYEDVVQLLAAIETRRHVTTDATALYVPDTGYEPDRTCEPCESASYTLPGACVTVHSELAGLVFQLDSLLTRPTKAVTSPAESKIQVNLSVYEVNGRFPLVSDGQTLDTADSLDDVVFKLVQEIAGAVAHASDYLIILHASAVALDDQGIVFPANCGSGKSTLAAYLAANGFRFLSDDAVPVLRKGWQLMPVPVAVSLKSGSWPVLARHYPALDHAPDLGPVHRPVRYIAVRQQVVQHTPVTCSLVVLPQFEADHPGASIEVVDPESLFEQIVTGGCLVKRPFEPDQIEALATWINSVDCVRLRFSSLPEAAQAIRQWQQQRGLVQGRS